MNKFEQLKSEVADGLEGIEVREPRPEDISKMRTLGYRIMAKGSYYIGALLAAEAAHYYDQHWTTTPADWAYVINTLRQRVYEHAMYRDRARYKTFIIDLEDQLDELEESGDLTDYEYDYVDQLLWLGVARMEFREFETTSLEILYSNNSEV